MDVYSANFDSTASFNLQSIEKDPENAWCDYVKGVAKILLDRGVEITGARMVIEGNVPQGSGLSSSENILHSASFAQASDKRSQ